MYNNLGQLFSLTDPVGNTTSYEYDSQRHVVKETNALEKSRYFEYLGQLLTRKIDRNGRVIEYVYDRFGRQKEEHWLEGKTIIKTIVNTYNETGNLIGVNDGLNSFEYEFNSLRLETQSIVRFDGLNKEIKLKSVYDRRGQKTDTESSYFVTKYAYTPNRLTESITQGNQSVRYSYDSTGQRISAKTPVVTTIYQYDGMGRLTKIDHQNVIHYDYQWDVANRVVSINDSKYNYDKTSQLIAANYDKLPVEKYTYDLNGNRSNYRTGKNNQLIHEGENMYEYDGEGNRISKGTTKYFWDHRNRLVKVETPQKTVEYVYDHKNRLVKRSTSKGTEYFIHDGWQVVLTLNQHGKANNYFLWGVNQDELIAQNEYYSLCDHLGTVRHLVGKGVVAHFEYNAFGQLLSKTGNTDCVFKYTGKMTDDVTGLQWNINRWYDSNVGRWISEDPIEFRGKNLNLYGYTNNKVINYFDPNGHMNLGAIKLGWEIAGFLTTGLSIFDLLSGPSFGTSVYSGTEFGHRYFQLDVEDISSSIATIDQQLSGNIPMPTPYGTTVVQFFGPDTITLEFNLELQEIDTFTSQIFVSIQDSRTFTRQEIESFRDIPTGRIRAAYSVDLSFKMRLPARNAIFEVSHYSPGTAFSPIGSTEEWCSKKVQINANSKLRVYGQSTTVSGSLSYSYSHSIDVIDQATSVGNFEVHN